MNFKKYLLTIATFAFLGLGCTKKDPTTQGELGVASEAKPDNEMKAHINATFQLANDGVNANLEITGLNPNSQHGLHIHKVGECTAPDFESAGDHFNPASQTHGAPGNQEAHLGDLGNVTADANGVFKGNIKIKSATKEGARGILNKSIIVHEKPDDLKSQPAGDSGARLACAVINSIDSM